MQTTCKTASMHSSSHSPHPSSPDVTSTTHRALDAIGNTPLVELRRIDSGLRYLSTDVFRARRGPPYS